jgi:hypothetical protein
MGYTVEQTTFIIISFYLLNGIRDENRMQSCKDQYLAKFPNLEIEEQPLMTHIRWIVNKQNWRCFKGKVIEKASSW